MENGRRMGVPPEMAAVIAANRVVEAKKANPGGPEHASAMARLANIVANNPVDTKLLGADK